MNAVELLQTGILFYFTIWISAWSHVSIFM